MISFLDLRKRVSVSLSRSRLAIPLIIACLVGVLTGFLVVGFIKFIELCHYFFFELTANQTLGFLGALSIILIPALGGLFVGPLVTFLAPEAKGHGVPEVMKAVALKGGRIRPIVVFVKALASALAIGSGASVGREGPIVQVGSALGSTIGQIFKMGEMRIKNLVACGAAAGVAGVFNTPIAGVMFALEVILRDFSARAMSTVVVSSVAASIVSRVYLGDSPAFIAPVYSLWSPFEIILYLVLGVLSAFTAQAFIATLHTSEKTFDAWKFPPWIKPAIGGLGIGIIGVFYPQIFGSGLETIEAALGGSLSLTLLLTLVVLKIFATSLSLGSGSSGGVFAPALFIGATLGGAFGKVCFGRFPFSVAPPGAYAIVGMASVFAAAAHAPATAILIVFEMTGDYRMILPIMIAAVTAVSLSQFISRESIYTIKLKQRGIDIGALEEVKVLGALQVRDAMNTDFELISRRTPVKELMEKMAKYKDKSFFVVGSKGELLGQIKRKEMQDLLLEKNLNFVIADDVANPLGEFSLPNEPLSEAARVMTAHHLTQIPVVSATDNTLLIGVLRSEDVFRAYTQETIKRDELISRLEQEGTHASGTVHMRFTVPTRSKISGKALKELDIPDGVVLTSIQRKSSTLVPEGETVLKGKDKVWTVVHPQAKEPFQAWLAENKLERFLLVD